MRRRNWVFAVLATCSMGAVAQTEVVTKGSAIEKVVTYTSVNDWGLVVDSMDVTVNDAKLLRKLTPKDFDIRSNVANTLYDPATGEFVNDYTEDGISLSVQGNVLRMRVRPFDEEGKRNAKFQKEPWQVICRNAKLSFSRQDVDDRKMAIIDECIHGEFSFGGLTREYMLYLPKDEHGNVIRRAPLFLWQIGGGEYNKDMMTVALANRCLAALPQHGEKCATLVFAIANPNYTFSASLYPEKLELIDRNNALQMAFIDTLIEDGTIDGNRLFCAGASSGGGCTMRFMMQFAHRFKAALPCCAMDPIVPIHKVEEKYEGQFTDDLEKAFQGKVYKWNGKDMELRDMDTQAFVNLPMFFVHAQDDNTCKVVSSHAYYNARKRLGARKDEILIYSDAQMKEYGFGGILAHFSWCRMLDDFTPGSAMDWLIRQMAGPRVQTRNGLLEGTEQSGLKIFKGIPYAAPPVGDLRWKEPQPVQNWTGVRSAVNYGPNPMQSDNTGDMNFGTPQKGEDCLYLNVWTPAKTMQEKLPVLVYFNGGGLLSGSGSEARYAGDYLARRGIVCVTVNYREGIFGFLAHPELTKESPNGASGNYGMLDQVVSLKWIQENIAAFGGDPSRVTIVGESAGSASVCALYLSPLTRGLFSQAIGSSGGVFPGFTRAVSLQQAEQDGIQRLQSQNYRTIREMRALTARELQDSFPAYTVPDVVVDGYFLPDFPEQLAERGEMNQVPLMAGWNSMEMNPMYFLRGKAPTLENMTRWAESLFGDRTAEILAAYGITADADVMGDAGCALAGDLFSAYSTWKWCHVQSLYSRHPVWRYRYLHGRPAMAVQGKVAGLGGGVIDEAKAQGTVTAPRSKDAVHSADIEYAMSTLPTNRVYDWQPEDYTMSAIFSGYYENFVKTGNPNGLGLPEWPMLNSAEVAPVLQLDVQSWVKQDALLEARYRLLDSVLSHR